jgi:uncharacterized membrane protein YphA (DoxX/SURF4 family)
MFPAGGPGIALLILRISLAAAIWHAGSDCVPPSLTTLLCVVMASQSLLLFFGFLTPIVSLLCCIFQIVSLFPAGHPEWHFVILSSLNAVAISLLGPGAYSLDARLFGLRVIVLPPDRPVTRKQG